VLRWSLWSLLAAVVALVLFARTEAGQERIRRAVEEAANSAMQEGSVRVGSVGGSLLGLAEFGDVVVSDGSGRAVVSVPEVSIRFGLWELLRREVHVERLSIRGAAIEPRILDDGGIDLARLFRMSAPSRCRSHASCSAMPETRTPGFWSLRTSRWSRRFDSTATATLTSTSLAWAAVLRWAASPGSRSRSRSCRPA
jgi:hypothetical protein